MNNLNIANKIKTFDVEKELHSNIALGQYRGDEIYQKIKSNLGDMSPTELLLIDLRNVVWLNTSFCLYALGPLFKDLIKNTWPEKYVIFQIHKSHRRELFQGILKSLDIDVPRKKAEEEFAEREFYIKIMCGNEEKIEFIGKLNGNHKKVLNQVNDLRKGTAIQVAEKASLEFEESKEILEVLNKLSHIIRYKDESSNDPCYFSFYNYFQEV